MISVQEAENIVLTHVHRPQTEKIPFEKSFGRILSHDVIADRDFPPFNRVAMDGIAFDYTDLNDYKIPVHEIQPAGSPQKTLKPGHAMEVMTGAILPDGATTVVRYEDVDIQEGIAHISAEIVNHKNIHWQGSDKNEGDLLVPADTKINAAVIGVLATVGQHQVVVKKLPKVAIISTGDELVEVAENPLPHQIRRSNVHTLQAICQSHTIEAETAHIPDEKDVLQTKISALLDQNDVLLLSGAVSKGKFDYLPEVLDSLGVVKHFHKVAQRPGKPFWFGTKADKTVFAFPGNPVSTVVCAVRYFVPWLAKSTGESHSTLQAILDADITFKPNLTNFLQVQIYQKAGKLYAKPCPGNGSGDLANLAQIQGVLELNQGSDIYRKNDTFSFWPIDARQPTVPAPQV